MRPTQFWKPFLILLSFLLVHSPSFSQNRTADSVALVAIYDDMGGVSWNSNSGWQAGGSIDTWFGVGFSGGRVITLSLGDNNLSGDVPVEIANLTALQSLDFQSNQITSIPDEIGDLAALTTFSIQENQISVLPAGIGSMSSLVFLDVSDNLLTTLPTEISSLISLTTLRAEFNQISTLPVSINGLTSLLQLGLDGNQLSSLPVELFSIPSLIELQLGENQLSVFPSQISLLTNLTILGLGDNQFSGSFPTELLSLTNLTDLDLGNNQFNGNIPTGISSLIALTSLNLHSNQFSGNIPTSITSLVILQSLDLGNNLLSGNIPTELGSLSSLTSLDLSINDFDGIVPSSLTGITNLQSLYINDNSLTGLPDLTSLTVLDEFFVSGNFIPEADITLNSPVINSNINSLQFIDATTFNYTASSAGFGFSTFVDPAFVTLQDDSVTFSSIPIGFDFDFFGSTYNSIYISSNGFITFLSPDQDSDGQSDERVDGCCSGDGISLSTYPNAYIAGYWEDLDPSQGGTIQYENLGSEFVVEFNNVPHLDEAQTVSFQIKLFEGTNNIEIHCSSCIQDSDSEVTTQGIEDELGFQGVAFGGRDASIFDLNSDAILFEPESAAPIPTLASDSLALVAVYNSTDGVNWFDNTNWVQLGSFVVDWAGVVTQNGRVTEINMPSNNLIGALPAEIGNLDSLTVLNIGDNAISSSLPTELYTLPILEGLYVSNNSLTGDLSQFSSLTNLREFYIDGNQLTGTIPADLSNLTSLEQLGVTNNQLEGILPEELSGLTSLVNLFVDDNPDLNGEVSLSFTTTNLDAFKVNGTGICEPGLSQYQDWTSTLSNYQGSGISCPQTVLASDSLALVAIYNATSGENWINNENWLQPGFFASEWSGITVRDGRVVGIDLNSFGVTGGFPAELGDLDALEVLGAANNQITSLPDELSQLANIVSIYLDNNQIGGTIPLALGNLVTLEELFLQGNQFSGTIPDTLSNLSNVRSLWLSQNRLTGEMPSALTTLSAVETLNLSENNLVSIPSDLSGMISLFEMNISLNDLDTISATLVLPDNLITLNLRGNALREAPDLTNPSLTDYNVENNRIPFSKLLTLSNTSGLGGQNYRYQIGVDNLLPSVGESVTISITSDDTDNTFQWYKDGNPLDGEINATLTLAGLEENDAGVYHAEVGNSLLPGVITFSEQFELEFGVTVKEYAISAIASSTQKINSQGEVEAIGFPNSYSQEDTRAWKPSELDSSPTLTVEFENATSFNTLWMSVNSNGQWLATISYSTDGSLFTEFPIGFSNVSGPGNNLLRWDFATVAEQAKFIRFELDSAQSINLNTSIDAVAIGLNDFNVNRPQDLILSQVISETIINIAWAGSDFGDGVIIERAVNSEAFQVIDTAIISDVGLLREPRGYSDRNAPISDSIFYRVRAFDGSDLSAYSNTLEIINCPTLTVLNTDNYWFGDADPNSFTGETSPQSEIVVRQIGDNSYNISDIAGGYMDLVALGFEYYPIEANFTFDCAAGQVSEVEFLTEAGVGCGDDNGLEFLGSTYFPDNDSIVFNLRWISCTVDFNSYLILTNVPAPEEVVPVQEPAIVKSISQPVLDKIEIMWQDINENEDFYLIERSVDVDNNFILIDSVAQITTSNDDPNFSEIVLGDYIDEDISSGSTFYYRLITRNATGDSDYSDTLSITKQSNLAFERLLDDPSVTDLPNFSYSGYWGDYDLDGDQDLYVHNWQKSSDPFYVAPNNYFYDNNGDGTFTKVNNGLTENPTQSRAGSWGDMDNDGDLDYVQQLVQNEVNKLGAFLLLYENDNGIFTETILGEPASGGFDHVVLGDFDNDGLLDILSKGFVYFNEGGLSFTETSFETIFPDKTASSEPNAHAVDIDLDMDLDIYFGGDLASYLYINNGDRTFSRSNQLGSDDIGHRGGAWGDYDNDGDFDLFITLERKPNNNSFRYYRNDGGGAFQLLEPADLGLDVLNLQRGATTIDYNNDGLLDLLSYETSEGNVVILENVGSGQFQKLEDPSFVPTNSLVSAVSVSDYDQDGNQDFFIASGFNSNQSNFIYRNAGSGNNYLRVNLEGTISNQNGIGAVINVFASGIPDQTHQVASVNGTWAGNEQTAHFGLGSATQADSVIVNWTSGSISILKDVAANQVIEIVEIGIPEVAFDSLALNTQEYRPELFGSVSDTSATIQIELQGKFYDAVNNMDSTWTLAAATVDSLFDGTYEVIARATNVVGVGVDTAMLVIDQSIPFVAIDDLISTDRSPELTGFVNDTTATVSVVVEDNDYLAIVNTSDSTWVLDEGEIQPPLEDGVYDILVFAENRFGVAIDTTTNELRLDATAPEIFVDNIGTSIASPELTGFVSDTTALIIVNVAGRGDFTPIINKADSTWSIPEGTIIPGFAEEDSPITITATAEDSLANSGSGTGELVITTTILALEPSRVTSNSFRANWSSVVDAVSYTLEVSDINDFSNLIVNENTTETSFEVKDLDFETEYFYRATFDNGVDAPITSDEISLLTDIKQGTLDDFNSLLQIEDATGGGSWTVASNWSADTRKQDWDYIELENERIVEIVIPGNNLTGLFPYTPLMTALRKIDVSDNELTEIEDLTRLRAIDELDVSNNLFEFDDLEKLRELTNFSYSPQKTTLSFNETAIADSLKVRVFSDTSLTVSIGGLYNTYEWFRNDELVASGDDFTISDSLLQILSIDYDNMGLFRAEVSNDSLQDLTIEVDSMFVFAVADFSVDVNGDDGELIPDNVDGYLLLTTQVNKGFDTLSVASNQSSSFTFNDVILGDYLISIDSDREKYVPTYYSDAFEWIEADTVLFRKDSAFQVSMTVIPDPNKLNGVGTLGVVIEEDFGETTGRIDARRRAAKRKCGLRRRTGSGRTGETEEEFELIAYGETNDNGEFEFGSLPEGVYRFFVEYPGIPLDESAFVEFEVGENGISDTEFKLEAFASEDGISVSIDRILGLIFDYFKDLKVYPNPTSDVLKISYRHLRDKDVAAQLVDLSGKVLWSKDVRNGYDGYEEIDVSQYKEGIYLLRIFDKKDSRKHVASYRIIVENN